MQWEIWMRAVKPETSAQNSKKGYFCGQVNLDILSTLYEVRENEK